MTRCDDGAAVPAAFVTSRLAEGLLYGVAPAAPHVLGVSAAALAMAAIIATFVPPPSVRPRPTRQMSRQRRGRRR